MKNRISMLSIVSLIISIVSVIIFWLLLNKQVGVLYVPWLIIGTISMFLPILSKYFRKRNDRKGKSLELAALVIGFYNLYWVLAVATKWNSTIIWLLCAFVCVLYGLLFKKTQVKECAKIEKYNEKEGPTENYSDDEIVTETKQPEHFAQTSKEDMAIEETAKIKKEPKQKFCGHCGSLIDSETKKCTGCGKRYFKGLKFNKYTLIITSLALLLTTSVGINVVQYNELNYLNAELFSLQNNYSILENENQTQQTLIDLYETYVVFVLDDSKIYHRSGCAYLKSKTLHAAWKTDIENMGYVACSSCHNSTEANEKSFEEILADSKNHELVIGIDYGEYKGTFHKRDCNLVKHLLDQWLPNQETDKYTEISFNKKGEFNDQKAFDLGYKLCVDCNCVE